MSIYPTNPRTWAQLDALDVDARRALLDSRDAASPQGPSAAYGPHGARLRYLRNADRDAELAAYFYPAAASPSSSARPKAVVVAVHGHGAYWQFEFLRMAAVGRPHVYEGSWVEALNEKGYSVCGLDNTGCGRSSGKFGLVERAEDLRDDVLALVSALRGLGQGGGRQEAGAAGASAKAGGKAKRAAPASSSASACCFGPALAGIHGFSSDLPLFLLGPSLGGCVAVQAALAAEARLAAASSSPPLPFAGVVLLAPLLGLEGAASRGWNPLLRRLAAFLDALPPTREWPVAAQDPNTMFPEQQLDFESDSVTYHYPCRVRTAVQLLRACAGVLPLAAAAAPPPTAPLAARQAAAEQAAALKQAQRSGQPLREAAKRLRAPLLAFHSARDTLCDCSATEAFVAGAREGRASAAAAGGSSAKAAAAAADGAKLRRCDHLWHSVLREDSRGELLREAIGWMDARVPLAGAAAAAAASAGVGGGGASKRARVQQGAQAPAGAVAVAGARATVTLSASAGPKVAAPPAPQEPAAANKPRAKRSTRQTAAAR
jgi:alpha-beta hydrolase superfamily lysophospholipase